MGDVRGLVKRLALGARSSQIEAKAFEYVRLATARLGTNALGNFEVCKSAVCVDLACVTLQVPVDSKAVMLSSGVSSVVYKNARAMLQKALGVRSSASPRDLCVQFGCAKIELPLRVTLTAFKEKYLQRLPPGDRAAANLTNPIFLAAVFSLVARKHKVKIARERLLTTLGLTSGELHRTTALVAEIVPDLVGIEEKKEKEEKTKNKKRKSAGDDGTENQEEEENENEDSATADGEEEEEEGNEEEKPKKQKKSSPAAKKKSAKKVVLTEKKLRQAVLAYAADDGPTTKMTNTATAAATTTTNNNNFDSERGMGTQRRSTRATAV